MPDERWAQIKEIFESAMERDVSERDSFVTWKCGSDDDLRQEVESLLLAHDSTENFLEDPYFELKSFAKDIESQKTLEPGTRIGAYRIDMQIGHGGMGAVYLATRADDEFRKQVAIKLIRLGGADEVAIRRFRNERQILASLEHPYVARLLDGGTTPGGMPYFVMEYVEGKSLVEYCNVHELHEKDRLELFLKICSAVHYAHRRSIVHRDLKPNNILVQEDGTPKLLDFGIAKLLAKENPEYAMETTLTGMRALTPAYASPEQLQGLTATLKSDLYSLGVILFEVLTGERFTAIPFRQSLEASAANTSFAGLHPSLRALVSKATQWEPERRYESAEAFAADIQRYLSDSPVLAQASYGDVQQAPALPGSIAILPFQMAEPDTTVNAYLAMGITDALITRLSRVGRIVVRPTSAVSKYVESRDAIQAGRELQVRYVLEGRLRTTSDSVRVSVQLVSVEAGAPVWAATIDEHSDDLLKLEDSISEQVAQALIPQLSGEEHEQLRRRGTASPKAHELYLKGRWHRSRSIEMPGELAKSLVCFMEAIAEDSSYARAHAGVADYYISLGIWGALPPAESFAAAKKAASTALELDPTLAEAHSSYAFALWACDGALDEAEQHFHLAITRDPDFPDAQFQFGMLNTARNRPELAIAYLERACKLQPDSPNTVAALASCFYNARDFERALDVLRECHTLSTHSWFIREFIARCYLRMGEVNRAEEEARLAIELGDRVPSSLAVLAQAYACNGKTQDAALLAGEIEKLAQTRYVSSCARATAQLALGHVDRCLELLEQAVIERDWRANFIPVSPDWDAVRADPRFNRAVSRLTDKGPIVPVDRVESAPPKKKRQLPALVAGAAVAAVLVLAFFIVRRVAGPEQPPFANVRLTRVTSYGTATAAAVSPDGKSIAYVSKEGKGFLLRVRRSGSDRTTQLTPPSSEVLSSLAFTNDGKYITFVSYPISRPGTRLIHMVPISGDASPQVVGTFGGPVSLSKDGNQVAFVAADDEKGRSELWVQRRDGSGKHVLSWLAYPNRFTGSYPPAWSSDGRKVACGVESTDKQGFLYRIMTVDLTTGKMREIPSPRWQWTRGLAWTKRDSDIAVIGQEQDSSFQQIWYLLARGGARRITNDLNDYASISVTSDSRSLVSVQVQTISNVYLLKGEANTSAPVQITTGSGRYFDLSWTQDGRLLYASDATGSADLWMMTENGTEQKQLSSITGRSYAPAASPDGRKIAYHSNKSGSWNIWKAEGDGSNPVQLTSDTQDSNWPQFTPDSNAIVYHHTGANGMFNIWKVPVNGGSPKQLTTTLTEYPTVSPRDGRIACWYSTNVDHPNWKLGVFSPQGGEPVQTFEIASTVVPDKNLRWTPSGEGITFLDGRGGASNLWLQPIDGSQPRALTSFTSGQIYSFDWSRDGRLAFSRGLSVSDVVSIQDTSK